MKKITTTILAMCLASACVGCAASENGESRKDSLYSSASAEQTELIRVYFDTFDKQIEKDDDFTVTATVTGGEVRYRALDENIVSVSAVDNKITVTGIAAGTTYVIATDAQGREYNSCKVTVKGNVKPIEPPVDPVDPVDPETPKEDNSGMIYDTYDLNTYLYPYWRGNTVYNETALFVGATDATPLMYPASKILKVTSYDHTVTYTEGVDYTYDKQANLLRRTANSRMPVTATGEWYTSTPTAFPYVKEPNKYLFFAEGNTISNKQVSITYEHEATASAEWTLPESHESDFSRLGAKLAAKQNVQILYYGDSVVYGANASGQVNCGLHAPTYAGMISNYIRNKFGVSVTDQNAATGGTRSDQATNYFPDYITGLQSDGQTTYRGAAVTVTPDLIVLGYGLNDSAQGRTPAEYVQSIDTLVNKARQKWANVDILVVAPTLGNPEAGFYENGMSLYKDDDAQEQALLNWYNQTAKNYGGIAVARVTTMHRQLYHKKGNRYRDITGNNINHPNDTGTRLIAQTCLHTLFGKDYFK